MGRKKKDRNIINIEELELENNIDIDYKKLARAIVEATQEVEKQKADCRKELEAITLEKRKEILGLKDFSTIKCKVWRSIRVFLNNIKMLWRILKLSKEDAEFFGTVSGLTKMLTSFLLFVIGLAFYVFAATAVCFSFILGPFLPYGIISAMIFVVFARLIRIARFEVERIDDNNYLLNISMMVMTVVTLALTVIGIVISSNNIGG
jgi:hypothetical protein